MLNNAEMPQIAEDELRRMVADSLKDPGSVQFRGIRYIEGRAICGEANAKNSYGGYVGFKAFVADGQGVYWAGDGSAPVDVGRREANRTYYPRAHAWGCL